MINKDFPKSLTTKIPANSFIAQIAKFKQLQHLRGIFKGAF